MKELEKEVKEWLKRNYYENETEVYVDYRDEIPEENIIKILEAKDSREAFYDYLDEVYQDTIFDIEDSSFNEMLKEFNEKGYKYEDEDELKDMFLEYFHVNIPTEHFLNQDVCCNIFVDSGDYDSDLSCNCIYPHYCGDSTIKCKDIANESCIVWLAKQQNYTKKNLFDALFKEKHFGEFLESVETELENCSSSSNSLVILKKYTLEELIDMKDDTETKFIEIDKNATIGLFDRWNGGGSCMGIKLEKNMNVKKENIREVIPDSSLHYSIHDVYGVTDRFWD